MTEKAESKSGLVSATEDAPSGRLSKASSQAPVTGAGFKLDVLVAERVMGWRDVGREVNEHHTEYVPFGIPLDDTRRVVVPRFSTSIADAWLVHLAICDKLFSVRRRYFDALQQQTRQTEGNGVDTFLVAWPDVLAVLRHKFPEAICLAALKAVGA